MCRWIQDWFERCFFLAFMIGATATADHTLTSEPSGECPMAELQLSRDDKLALKARAHHIDPVVLLGAAGLSEAALKEIDRALRAHGLVKVRAASAERDERE